MVICAELKELILHLQGVEEEEVSPDARLEDDLGITGDDAYDLLIAYGRRFNVDVSQFMAAAYFDGEADGPLHSLMKYLTGTKNKVLTVGHLQKGIIAGRLDDNVINS